MVYRKLQKIHLFFLLDEITQKVTYLIKNDYLKCENYFRENYFRFSFSENYFRESNFREINIRDIFCLKIYIKYLKKG